MISCVSLERPGKWRSISLALLLLAIALPVFPILWGVATSIDLVIAPLSGPFRGAIQNSILVAFFTAAASLMVGLPLGTVAALYEFPGRNMLLALAALPLLVPSFLWALGWSSLAIRLGPAATELASGLTGCILVFSASTIPLVLLTSYAGSGTLAGSQVDAARLAGGEKAVVTHAVRYAATPALLAAGLGGVLTLSDPGPGQILRLRTGASEILTSFAAMYDFTLAAGQCLVLTLLVLAFTVPLAFFAAPRIASAMLARQLRPVQRLRHRPIATVATVALTGLVLTSTLLPLVGLALPALLDRTGFGRALTEVVRTAGNTLLYAAGAGVISVVLALLMTFCIGRIDRLLAFGIGIVFALFSLPPTLAALGIVQMAAEAPAWADPILRSRLTVCVALGLRFFPVAAVIALRTWGSTSPSWSLAAGIHGVPVVTYLRRVALPLMLPAGAVAMLVVALLATADIGTVLLLHPPGATSFPLAIFTVMANAPESLVAALCLVYVTAAGGILALVWTLAGSRTS